MMDRRGVAFGVAALTLATTKPTTPMNAPLSHLPRSNTERVAENSVTADDV